MPLTGYGLEWGRPISLLRELEMRFEWLVSLCTQGTPIPEPILTWPSLLWRDKCSLGISYAQYVYLNGEDVLYILCIYIYVIYVIYICNCYYNTEKVFYPLIRSVPLDQNAGKLVTLTGWGRERINLPSSSTGMRLKRTHIAINFQG